MKREFVKKLSFIVCTLIFPEFLQAAGTYYNGNYTGLQNRYRQSAGFQASSYQPGQGRPMNISNTGYNSFGMRQYTNGYQRTNNYLNNGQNGRFGYQNKNLNRSNNSKNINDNKKFILNAGLSREIGTWNVEMKETGSILTYNNLSWNVFSANVGYSFDAGDVKLKIDGGLKYGLQSGSSSMVDDDITKGGPNGTKWYDEHGNLLAQTYVPTLSIGTSSNGNQFGLNFGLGFQDIFKLGKANFTPSFGYRIFKHKLQTSKNYGLAIERTENCKNINGEKQCDTILVAVGTDGQKYFITKVYDKDGNQTNINIPNQTLLDINSGNSYYFSQPGISHLYDTYWNGLYLAMDMNYEINENNNVDGRLELGLPSYYSQGSQPYRRDWQNPKSVEDSKSIFGAIHFGLKSNYNTNISDNVMLSIGFTYDYYSVDGANAKTYLNSEHYNNRYKSIEDHWKNGGHNLDDLKNDLDLGAERKKSTSPYYTMDSAVFNTLVNYKLEYKYLKRVESECKGWVCSVDNEISSFYKSMGIRAGIKVKF